MTDDLTESGAECDAIDPYDPADREHWIKLEHLGRYLFAVDFLAQVHPSRVADIACGTGYGTAELARLGCEVIAVDNDLHLLGRVAALGFSNVRIQPADLHTDDLTRLIPAESLSAIVCYETLEHLPDADAALAQLHAILAPQGYLLISVPDRLYESKDRAGLPYNRNHRQFFTYHSLTQHLLRNGFEVLYRLGQGTLNTLARRETQLIRWKELRHRIADFECAHQPEFIRTLSRLLAYPAIDDTDGSYSILLLARRR